MNTLTGTALLISGLALGGPAFAPVTVALNAFSVSLGGQFAVATYDPGAYCAHGEEIRAELAEDTEGLLNVLMPAG